MAKSYENIEELEFIKEHGTKKRISVTVSFTLNKYWVVYRDEFGEDIDIEKHLENDLDKSELNLLLEYLEELKFFEWPTSKLVHYGDPTPDIPYINYFMKDREEPYTAYGDFHDVSKMRALYQRVNAITGKHMNFSKRGREFYKIHDHKSIDTVLLSVLGGSGTRYDVFADLEEWTLTIEALDDDGNLVEERDMRELTNIQISKYKNLLKEMNFLQWEIMELKSEPDVLGTDLELVEYYIGSARFFTVGDSDDASQLQELIKKSAEILKMQFD